MQLLTQETWFNSADYDEGPCMKEGEQTSLSWLEKLSHLLTREPQDRSEILVLLDQARHRNLLKEDALEMIQGVFTLSDLQASDIMTPKLKTTALYADQLACEAIEIALDSKHSRFPVLERSSSQVIGILLAKDLLRYVQTRNKDQDLASFIREAFFIPENKRLDALLKDFRNNQCHMAVVVDEHGNAVGILTIEDILEQIVGDIIDEHDTAEQENNITQTDNLEYLIKAATPIEEFNEYFNTHYSAHHVDTIAGLIFTKVGYLPKTGEVITFDDFKITILKAGQCGLDLIKANRYLAVQIKSCHNDA
eukprot:TRINITY_DN21263_c0_g1_i1.p2 TRINITY_DN21263_c0_g1~~TRINITY_DN21263_c0_g1_i1.p2  ORF type:complete len:308 (+),score=-34.06 TRINITY_DN21263_c0_g1_i1:1450-2373(+)